MPMTDEAFASLVAEDVKKKVTTDQHDYLELPENLARWQRTLEALSRNLQDQLDAVDAKTSEGVARYTQLGHDGAVLLTEFTTTQETKRKRIARFKSFTDRTLDDVQRQVEMTGDEPTEREGIVEFLRQAIERHRSLFLDNDFEPTVVDHALWAALEGKWNFDKITRGQLVESTLTTA